METFPSAEDLASSVVREFLSRKRCSAALQELDKELPRTNRSINNRSKLVQSLSIKDWMDKNKVNDKPFNTMLEIIIWNILKLQKATNNLAGQNVSNEREQLCADDKSLNKSLNKQSALNTSQTNPHSDVTTLGIEDLDDADMDMNDSVPKPAKMDMSRRLDDVLPKSLLDSKYYSSELHGHQKSSHSGGKKPVSKKKVTSVFEMLSASPEKAISNKKQTVEETASNFPWDMPYSKRTPKEGTKKQPSKDVLQHVDISTISISDESTCEDNEIYSWKDVKLVEQLRTLVLGSVKCVYPTEWINQSFSFCDCFDGRPKLLRFGIIQNKGGPCGILASVQATVLKHLLFGSEDCEPQSSVLNASNIQRNKALVEAITEIIWRAGNEKSAYLIISNLGCDFNPSASYKADNFSETVTAIHYMSQEKLRIGVQEHIKCYLQGKGACLMLLYSAIMSRGLQNVKSDMDEPSGRLMGAHNYCTQEMINLLLTGRATSNAFDNAIRLDETTVLKGVHRRSEIGLLSLFEHYDSCKVGEFYKTPKYPIWVVCSESHFTVLFSFDGKILNSSCILNPFDLVYYDGLANQDEYIKLTVDANTGGMQSRSNEDLIPPLDHCIRTKWPNAVVDWNTTEPIL